MLVLNFQWCLLKLYTYIFIDEHGKGIEDGNLMHRGLNIHAQICKWQFHIISWKKILYLFYSNFTEVGSLDPIDDMSVIV